MTPQMSQICEELGVLVKQTTSLLVETSPEGAKNPHDLSQGLGDAHDTGLLLCVLVDHGIEVPVDLIDAVERLVRATLEIQPLLMRRDIDHRNAEAPPALPEVAEPVSDLWRRAMHASIELHRGLAGIYRNAIERGVER